MNTDLFQSCGHCWVFQICWQIECSSFTASFFRIWNSSTGIPSPPLALCIVMLPKAHLTLYSRMSGSRWVSTPSWLSGQWRSFLYSSVYSCHLSLISPAAQYTKAQPPVEDAHMYQSTPDAWTNLQDWTCKCMFTLLKVYNLKVRMKRTYCTHFQRIRTGPSRVSLLIWGQGGQKDVGSTSRERYEVFRWGMLSRLVEKPVW